MELGPEDVPLLERCPHFRGWSWDLQMCPIKEVSFFQRELCQRSLDVKVHVSLTNMSSISQVMAAPFKKSSLIL